MENEELLFTSYMLAVEVIRLTGPEEPEELCHNSLVTLRVSGKEVTMTGEELDQVAIKWLETRGIALEDLPSDRR